MKFSVMLLVQHSSCCTNPRASATAPAKAALPEEISYPWLPSPFSLPWGCVQGCCPKWDRWRGSGQRATCSPYTFSTCKAGVSQPTSLLQARVGAGGSLSHHPHGRLARQGSICPRGCQGAGEGARSRQCHWANEGRAFM